MRGNRIEVLEVAHDETRTGLAGNAPLGPHVVQDGIVVHGLTMDQLLERVHA